MQKASLKLNKLNVLKPACLALASILLFSGCQSGPFNKEPVPEPRYIPEIGFGEIQKLTILSVKQPCNTSLPMLCMVAKNQSGELFQIPYHWIEGFNHANGIEYVINAKPKLDMKTNKLTGKWILQNVVSQQIVSK